MISKLFKRIKSLKRSLLLIVLLCFLIPTAVLTVFMCTTFFSSLREKTESALISGAEHARVLLTNQLNYVITLAKDITYDGDLTEAAASYESGKIRYQDYLKISRNYIERKFSRERMCTFALFFRLSDPDMIVNNTQGYFQALDFQKEAQKDVMALCETLDTKSYFFAYGDTTLLIRNLYNEKLERYGIFAMGLDMEALLEPVSAAAGRINTNYALTLDDYANGKQIMDLPLGLIEKDGMLCYTQAINDYDYALRFQTQADKHAVYREMESFRNLAVLLFVLMIPFIALIMRFVNQRIIRPVELLSNASARIQNGELGVVVPMHGEDELGRLGISFSSMSLRLKELIDICYKEEIALRDARIQAMQSRINPHFINNALEIINWQARIDGNENVAMLIEALSVLLNASMDRDDRQLTSIREEMKIADAYFLFVGLRFGEKITIEKQVEEETLSVEVPRLLLQTLLENAVEHGLTPAGGGRIELCIRRGGGLYIRVSNTGVQVTDDDLERIRAIIRNEPVNDGHLGLRNVSERLRLIFGEQAQITIDREQDGMTSVQVRIIDQKEERV